MGRLDDLKAEEVQVGRLWLDLLFRIDEAASMRAEDPESGALENFRALQQRALEAGRRRVTLQTRIAELERHQRCCCT
jgi:hypothetical protein